MDRILALVFIMIGVIITGSVIIYSLEAPYENSKINTFLDAVWWTVATITTVGYGDVIPVTDAGKIMAIVYMLFAISYVLIFLTVVGTKVYNRLAVHNDEEILRSQEIILGRINELEKGIQEIRDEVKQNSK